MFTRNKERLRISIAIPPQLISLMPRKIDNASESQMVSWYLDHPYNVFRDLRCSPDLLLGRCVRTEAVGRNPFWSTHATNVDEMSQVVLSVQKHL
jgi:hypothetical protein